MTTTTKDIVERLILLMQTDESTALKTMPEGNYHMEFTRNMEFPNCVVFLDNIVFDRAGIGWTREMITLNVWFRTLSMGETEFESMYGWVEGLERLLESCPALVKTGVDALDGVEQAVARGATQMFGTEAGYVVDLIECKVEVYVLRSD